MSFNIIEKFTQYTQHTTDEGELITNFEPRHVISNNVAF